MGKLFNDEPGPQITAFWVIKTNRYRHSNGGFNQFNDPTPREQITFLNVGEQWPSNKHELDLIHPRVPILGPEDDRYHEMVSPSSIYIVDIPLGRDQWSNERYWIKPKDREMYQNDYEHHQTLMQPVYQIFFIFLKLYPILGTNSFL